MAMVMFPPPPFGDDDGGRRLTLRIADVPNPMFLHGKHKDALWRCKDFLRRYVIFFSQMGFSNELDSDSSRD